MPPCTMPKSALALPRRSNSARERAAQRSDSSIDSPASAWAAGYGVHSSNTITMSESSVRWICIDSSGVRKSLSPFTGDAKATPSSCTRRRGPRLHTWKPPESVRIGLSHAMKRWSPACAAITSSPGRSHRWKVLPRTICAPISTSSFGAIAFTVP